VTADAAYVNTAGNSEVQTLTGNEKVEYKSGKWLWTQDAAAVWGTDDGVENAGRYYAGLRADYAVATRLSLYGLATWRRNTFAAIKRQFDEGLGVSYHVLIPNPHQLDLEAGAGLSQRENTLGESDDFSTGRLAALYRYYFREKTYFEANGIYLANFEEPDDYEYDIKSALVAPLSGILALKLGYNYHYRNQPPAGVKTWDSTFAAGIQVTY
jgi:putative salt-induced outer membrane protein YdiY